jgi:hypothetical protein
VYQEGRKQTDEWLPDKPAYLRIYLDIPGQHERVKHNKPLGKSATREEARRKADRWIMRNGVNDGEKLEFALQPSEILSARRLHGGSLKSLPVASSLARRISAARKLEFPLWTRTRLQLPI